VKNFTTIILRQRTIFKTSARYTEVLWLKTGRASGRPSTYAPTISTILNRIMLRKEILTVKRKIYAISLAVSKLEEKLLKENTGSDKGKLVPTDIGTIVTDFL
jgi:DNA topoisomerase-1